MNNFKICNGDTDSISIYKSGFEEFSEEERKNLIKDLNNKCSQGVIWEDDGYYKSVIILKAKNYVLYDGKKIKYKGSSLLSPTLEPALREFLKKITEAILNEQDNFKEIYLEYVREINNITDIKRWSSRKTLSSKTFESERTNESKIRDAIEDTEYVEGDRVYCYFAEDDSLKLVEHYNNDHNKQKMLEKLFKASKRFETVLPYKELFINYALKRNQKALEELLK